MACLDKPMALWLIGQRQHRESVGENGINGVSNTEESQEKCMYCTFHLLLQSKHMGERRVICDIHRHYDDINMEQWGWTQSA